jgi:two-component system, NtrC family, response regulator AtoC
VGRFEQASGGTLFLDEIGDLDIDLQAKLLRVLQSGQFERVGGNETLQVDVRVIAATNRNLPALIAEQRFREDLFYRLNVVLMELPPLRARPADIPLLAEHIIRRLARKYQWPQLALAPDAVQYLCRQPWPGNVRQMQNVLARAAILVRGRLILAEDLRPSPPATVETPADWPHDHLMSLKDLVAETEHRAIQHALEQTGWNRTQAARLLGISRRQLFDKIRQYGLQR